MKTLEQIRDAYMQLITRANVERGNIYLGAKLVHRGSRELRRFAKKGNAE